MIQEAWILVKQNVPQRFSRNKYLNRIWVYFWQKSEHEDFGVSARHMTGGRSK